MENKKKFNYCESGRECFARCLGYENRIEVLELDRKNMLEEIEVLKKKISTKEN